jgi:hypothetical protein
VKEVEWVDQTRKTKVKSQSRPGEPEWVLTLGKEQKRKRKSAWLKTTSFGLYLLPYKTLMLALGEFEQLLDIPQLVDVQRLDVP